MTAAAATRTCQLCNVAEHESTCGFLALCGDGSGRLVCSECDDAIERAWVAEDPDCRRHSLDALFDAA